jgi:hypothetical protein
MKPTLIRTKQTDNPFSASVWADKREHELSNVHANISTDVMPFRVS